MGERHDHELATKKRKCGDARLYRAYIREICTTRTASDDAQELARPQIWPVDQSSTTKSIGPEQLTAKGHLTSKCSGRVGEDGFDPVSPVKKLRFTSGSYQPSDKDDVDASTAAGGNLPASDECSGAYSERLEQVEQDPQKQDLCCSNKTNRNSISQSKGKVDYQESHATTKKSLIVSRCEGATSITAELKTKFSKDPLSGAEAAADEPDCRVSDSVSLKLQSKEVGMEREGRQRNGRMADKDDTELMKHIEGECVERMEELVKKHEEEIHELHTRWERRKIVLEEDYQREANHIFLKYTRPVRTNKLDKLYKEFTSDMKECQCQKDIFLENLQDKQLAEKNRESQRAAQRLDELKEYSGGSGQRPQDEVKNMSSVPRVLKPHSCRIQTTPEISPHAKKGCGISKVTAGVDMTKSGDEVKNVAFKRASVDKLEHPRRADNYIGVDNKTVSLNPRDHKNPDGGIVQLQAEAIENEEARVSFVQTGTPAVEEPTKEICFDILNTVKPPTERSNREESLDVAEEEANLAGKELKLTKEVRDVTKSKAITGVEVAKSCNEVKDVTFGRVSIDSVEQPTTAGSSVDVYKNIIPFSHHDPKSPDGGTPQLQAQAIPNEAAIVNDLVHIGTLAVEESKKIGSDIVNTVLPPRKRFNGKNSLDFGKEEATLANEAMNLCGLQKIKKPKLLDHVISEASASEPLDDLSLSRSVNRQIIETGVEGRPPSSEGSAKLIKRIEMECEERMLKLIKKHQEEIQEFHRSWERKRLVLEKDHKKLSARICSVYGNPIRSHKLDELDNQFVSKTKEYECERKKSLKDLTDKQLQERNEERQNAAHQLKEAKCYFSLCDESELPFPGSENGNAVACFRSSQLVPCAAIRGRAVDTLETGTPAVEEPNKENKGGGPDELNAPRVLPNDCPQSLARGEMCGNDIEGSSGTSRGVPASTCKTIDFGATEEPNHKKQLVQPPEVPEISLPTPESGYIAMEKSSTARIGEVDQVNGSSIDVSDQNMVSTSPCHVFNRQNEVNLSLRPEDVPKERCETVPRLEVVDIDSTTVVAPNVDQPMVREKASSDEGIQTSGKLLSRVQAEEFPTEGHETAPNEAVVGCIKFIALEKSSTTRIGVNGSPIDVSGQNMVSMSPCHGFHKQNEVNLSLQPEDVRKERCEAVLRLEMVDIDSIAVVAPNVDQPMVAREKESSDEGIETPDKLLSSALTEVLKEGHETAPTEAVVGCIEFTEMLDMNESSTENFGKDTSGSCAVLACENAGSNNYISSNFPAITGASPLPVASPLSDNLLPPDPAVQSDFPLGACINCEDPVLGPPSEPHFSLSNRLTSARNEADLSSSGRVFSTPVSSGRLVNLPVDAKDSIEIEIHRLCKENEQVIKLQQDLETRLKSDHEKEISERTAHIKRKYEARLRDAEEAFSKEKVEIDRMLKTVHMNRALAWVARSTDLNCRLAEAIKAQEGSNSTLSTQLVQLLSLRHQLEESLSLAFDSCSAGQSLGIEQSTQPAPLPNALESAVLQPPAPPHWRHGYLSGAQQSSLAFASPSTGQFSGFQQLMVPPNIQNIQQSASGSTTRNPSIHFPNPFSGNLHLSSGIRNPTLYIPTLQSYNLQPFLDRFHPNRSS